MGKTEGIKDKKHRTIFFLADKHLEHRPSIRTTLGAPTRVLVISDRSSYNVRHGDGNQNVHRPRQVHRIVFGLRPKSSQRFHCRWCLAEGPLLHGC